MAHVEHLTRLCLHSSKVRISAPIGQPLAPVGSFTYCLALLEAWPWWSQQLWVAITFFCQNLPLKKHQSTQQNKQFSFWIFEFGALFFGSAYFWTILWSSHPQQLLIFRLRTFGVSTLTSAGLALAVARFPASLPGKIGCWEKLLREVLGFEAVKNKGYCDTEKHVPLYIYIIYMRDMCIHIWVSGNVCSRMTYQTSCAIHSNMFIETPVANISYAWWYMVWIHIINSQSVTFFGPNPSCAWAHRGRFQHHHHWAPDFAACSAVAFKKRHLSHPTGWTIATCWPFDSFS